MPTPKSPGGRWEHDGTLKIDGKVVAKVTTVAGRAYYEIPALTPMKTGWARGYYAAQRAVRKALKEAADAQS